MKPIELARSLGIQLWTPIYRKGKGVAMKQTDDGAYVHLGDLPKLAAQVPSGLLSLGAEAMARMDYELHQEEMGYETVWEEETQGHRNIYLDAAKGRLRVALDAAQPSSRDEEVRERFIEEVRHEAVTLRTQASDSEARASLDHLSAHEIVGEQAAAHALSAAADRLSGALERLDGKQAATSGDER